jgi:hypothetical protein
MMRQSQDDIVECDRYQYALAAIPEAGNRSKLQNGDRCKSDYDVSMRKIRDGSRIDHVGNRVEEHRDPLYNL